MNMPLQQLKDIHLPHAIPIWPLAPGWLILFALGIGLIGYMGILVIRRNQKRRIIKFAIKTLNALKTENSKNINIAAEISTLIRRTALYYFHRENIAGLSGIDWLHFLNESGNTTQFTENPGRLLIDAPYRKSYINDLTPLFALTQAWLVTIAKKDGFLKEQ